MGLLDIKRAFLQGEFGENENEMYVNAPDRLKDKYPNDAYLKLLASIYSLKNEAIVFWIKLLKVMKRQKCEHSLADLYLHFK